MRRHQLSFTIENFSENRNYDIRGYIDANNPLKVLQEMLKECHKVYGDDVSFEEFCHKIEQVEYDGISITDVKTYEKPQKNNI